MKRFKDLRDTRREWKEREKALLAELGEAKKAREDALTKMETAVKKQEDRERYWAEKDKVAKDLHDKLRDALHGLEAAARQDHENASKVLEERNALEARLEKAVAENEELNRKLSRAAEEFKDSEEGNSWVNAELVPLLGDLGEEIMHFVDSELGSEHPGIDWKKQPYCKNIIDNRRGAAAVVASGDLKDREVAIVDESDEGVVVVDEVPPSERTREVPTFIIHQEGVEATRGTATTVVDMTAGEFGVDLVNRATDQAGADSLDPPPVPTDVLEA